MNSGQDVNTARVHLQERQRSRERQGLGTDMTSVLMCAAAPFLLPFQQPACRGRGALMSGFCAMMCKVLVLVRVYCNEQTP